MSWNLLGSSEVTIDSLLPYDFCTPLLQYVHAYITRVSIPAGYIWVNKKCVGGRVKSIKSEKESGVRGKTRVESIILFLPSLSPFTPSFEFRFSRNVTVGGLVNSSALSSRVPIHFYTYSMYTYYNIQCIAYIVYNIHTL